MIQGTERELKTSLNRTERAIEAESSFWKTVTVGILTAFFAAVFSYLFFQFLTSSSGSFWLFFSALIVFSLAFLLQNVLVGSFKTLIGFVLADSLILSFFLFGRGGFYFVLGGSLAVFAFLTLAAYQGFREIKSGLSIRFIKVGKAVMTGFMTAIAIFSSFSYIGVASTGSVSFVSKDLLSGILLSSSSTIEKIYPGFSFEKTFYDNLEALAYSQESKNPQIALLSSEQKNLMHREIISAYENQIVSFFGKSINFRDKTLDTLYFIISTKMSEAARQFGTVFYVIALVFIFLLIKGVAPVVYWPVVIISFFVYQLLLAFGFATVLLEMRSKEVVILK